MENSTRALRDVSNALKALQYDLQSGEFFTVEKMKRRIGEIRLLVDVALVEHASKDRSGADD